MKKTIALLFIAVVAVSLTGCGIALHNAGPTKVSLVVTNFPDGNWSFVGNFLTDNWNPNVRTFTVAGGAGSYTTPSTIKETPFAFSIVIPGGWNRAWYPTVTGNTDDFGNGLLNFTHEIPFDGTAHEISIDGSDSSVFIDGTLSEYTP